MTKIPKKNEFFFVLIHIDDCCLTKTANNALVLSNAALVLTNAVTVLTFLGTSATFPRHLSNVSSASNDLCSDAFFYPFHRFVGSVPLALYGCSSVSFGSLEAFLYPRKCHSFDPNKAFRRPEGNGGTSRRRHRNKKVAELFGRQLNFSYFCNENQE